MKEYTLQDLKERAEKEANSQKLRLRARYALAKSLGFTASEAKILSFKPEETIKRLAKENN